MQANPISTGELKRVQTLCPMATSATGLVTDRNKGGCTADRNDRWYVGPTEPGTFNMVEESSNEKRSGENNAFPGITAGTKTQMLRLV